LWATTLESKLLEFKTRPVMYLCSSEKEVGSLVEKSKEASSASGFLLLVDESERSTARALPAYVSASIRFREGIARSKSMQMEMLMLLCGTMNIGKALRECGAKRKERFMLFATNGRLFRRFAKANGIREIKKVDLRIETRVAGEVAITELLNG
jgi:hypothetical protein